MSIKATADPCARVTLFLRKVVRSETCPYCRSEDLSERHAGEIWECHNCGELLAPPEVEPEV